MTTLASFAAGRTFLRWFGVSPGHYQVLVDLFDALGERKELFGNLGIDKHAMELTTLTLLLPGVFLALLAFNPMSLAAFNMLSLVVSSMLLSLLLVNEAANTFFNPAEATVLAHKPIDGATYFAAKFSYLVTVVLRAQGSISGPSAFTGLLKEDARWFYPLTHMFAACACGIFIALVLCAVFGVLFRIVPTSKVRNAAMWAQLVVSILPFAANLSSRRLTRMSSTFAPLVSGVDWSFVPLTWFNTVALVGQGGGLVPLRWPAAAGLLVSCLFIAFGVRSLSAGYLTRIVGVMRSSRRRRAVRRSVAPFSTAVRWITGRPSGQAAFPFLMRMMRADWQFRRAAIGGVLPLAVIFVPAIVLSGREMSLFRAPDSLIGLLPAMLTVGTLVFCLQLPYLDHYKGAWIFGIAPGAAIETFLRGVCWSLWLVLLALPLGAAMIFYSPYWGVVDAVLFAAYGLAASSFLLGLQLLFVDGLPFASAPRAETTYMLFPLTLFGPVALAVAWFVQSRFIFHSRVTTAIATVIVGLVAKITIDFAARRMAVNARRQIAAMGGGAAKTMFASGNS